MTDRFSEADLDELRRTDLVEIVTARGRQTVIWVVVDDQDRVLIRSVRGPRGYWYRQALADPLVELDLGGRRIPVRAELADDADRVEATSQALRAKYARQRASLAAMLRPETLPTTLQLLPR